MGKALNTDKKEFQTVYLSTLLHDIGKFYARSKRVTALRREAEVSGSHPIISTLIVEGNFKKLLERIGFDTNFVKTLIQHHHEDPRFPEECLVNSLKGKEKILALLISRADNYSSAERYEDATREKTSYERALMDSIFSRVSLGSELKLSELKVKPLLLSPQNIFPQKIEFADWNKLVEDFGREINALQAQDFNTLFTSLMTLISKYCWTTPSDITREVRDISLSDHLKTTSAIAACLYKFHFNTNTLNEESIKNESVEKFMLIGGDLSGIQRYIYDIAEVGVGGVAKRLRARSFRLSLLMEVTAHYILQELDLPLSCLIFSSGGRFYILAPADSKSKMVFKETKAKIESWLLENYQGELAINLAEITFSPSYFSSNPEKYPENFKGLWEKFTNEVEKAKLKKFNDTFIRGGKWEDKFLGNIEYGKNSQGVCKSCGKLPAKIKFEEYKICNQCFEDAELGKKLLNARFLSFYKDGEKGDLNFYGNYSVKITLEEKIEGNPYLVSSLNNVEVVSKKPFSFKFIANYVPYFQSKEEMEKVCEKCKETDCEIKNLSPPYVYSFSCIANVSEGAKYLGILKADVDNLGYILSNGLKNLSLSRLTTLSNYLDLFFSGYLPLLLKKDFPLSYVVYSGGDDLLLCGPWSEIIELSKKIVDKFREFTCFNPDIHLSAGIVLCRPKFPFARIAQVVTETLEKAKDKGRNRLAAFSSCFEWKIFDEVSQLGRLLADSLDSKEISHSFVYKLLYYQEMYQAACEGDNSGYLYLSRLSYSIRRNLFDSQEKPKNPQLVNELKKLLDTKEVMLMENLKFPVSYALLKQRGESK